MEKINKDLSSILFDEKTIRKRIKELGKQLSEVYKDKNPILVCVLSSAFVFLSDLMRNMSIPVEIDFMSVSSYGNNSTSSGNITIRKDISKDLTNRDVIIVEDIADTGWSLSFIKEHLAKHNPNSVIICALLNKELARKTKIKIDYFGFEVGNQFIVGYGLDYAEKYRNLPYIGVLKEEIYK
jgi:hypoxanthine phosphoribosyltransferase